MNSRRLTGRKSFHAGEMFYLSSTTLSMTIAGGAHLRDRLRGEVGRPYALAIRSDCHASTRVTRAERAVIRGPKDGVVVGPMKWTGRSGKTLHAVVGCVNLP
jgi:hypothetical protein